MRHIRCTMLLVTLFITPHLAAADTLPARKAGLWETSVSSDNGAQNQKIKECVDPTTDAEMMKFATDSTKAMGGTCSKNSLTRTSTGFESDSECMVGGSTITSKGTFTGDFTSEYRGEVTTTYAPAMFGMSRSKTAISSKFIGPCSADMKPGDVLMANGIKTNMKDSIAQAEKVSKMLKGSSAGEGKMPFNGDIGQAMAAAQAQMSPEDIKAMQEAMKSLGEMGQ